MLARYEERISVVSTMLSSTIFSKAGMAIARSSLCVRRYLRYKLSFRGLQGRFAGRLKNVAIRK
jgi:transposase-like protein